VPDRLALTLFNGRAGDHNDRAMAGGPLLAAELADRLDLEPVTIGSPEPALNTDWETELAAAMPALRQLTARCEDVQAAGQVPVTALSRCAVALATIPVVVQHHPDARVVWFDPHADLNTPATTTELKQRWKCLRRIRLCPSRIGDIVAAGIVLSTLQRGNY